MKAVILPTDLVNEIPNVIADRVQLQQTLMNLMHNGIEAMPDVALSRSIIESRGGRICPASNSGGND